MNVIVVNEKNMFVVHLIKKGCEHYAYYKPGEIARNGSDNDLSAMGRDLYQWQEVAITVKNKDAVISINGKKCFEEKYKKDFGKIEELIFVFERTGSVDFVNLSDTTGHIVYEDNFDWAGVMKDIRL